MKKLLVISIVGMTLAGCQTTGTVANAGNYGNYNWDYKASDSDWNTSLRPVCKTARDSIAKISQGGETFVRAEIDDQKLGLCSSDKKGNRQRAEFATVKRMDKPGVYEYSANIRFNTPITQEAVFFQIHAKNNQCKKVNGITTHPPLKLRMRYNMEVINLEPGHYDRLPGVKDKMAFVKGKVKVGQWHQLVILMDFKIGTSYVDIYLDGAKIASKFPVGTMNNCVKPWGKLGIYRESPTTYGKSGPWEKISIDYDKISLRRISN